MVKSFSSAHSEEEKKDFYQEIALVAQFKASPYFFDLVGVVTAGRGQDPLMLLEMVEHGPLLELLGQYRLSKELCGVLAGDVGDALDYLAGTGYVHRDVGARNVLVTVQWRAKLGDLHTVGSIPARTESLPPVPQHHLACSLTGADTPQ